MEALEWILGSVRECLGCVQLSECQGKLRCFWRRARRKTNEADPLLGVYGRTPIQVEEEDGAFHKQLAEVSQPPTLAGHLLEIEHSRE